VDVADVPQYLTLKRHRDLVGRERVPWTRRAVFLLVAAAPVVGLVNVFGQRPVTSTASAPAATLQVDAADNLRGGLLGQVKFRVTARRELKHTTLVLDRGWYEGMQVNTIAPDPLGQAQRDGDRIALDFGHLPAGRQLVVRMQFQVDPTTFGNEPQGVELADGDQRLARVDRTVTVFP
jgi:hypothetical protein